MRYRLMKKSTTQAVTDNSYYPDVLTANFDNIDGFFNPAQVQLTQVDIDRFDLFVAKAYGRFEYMDLLLEINNIEHRTEITAGDYLLLPSKVEMDRFIKSRKVTV